MRRLLTRMVLSHVLVAVLAALTTVLVIRLVALRAWEGRTQGGMRPGGAGSEPGMRPGGPGRGSVGAAEGFRQQVIASLDQGALIGLSVGVVAALLLAVIAARRISGPVARLGQATRAIAAGRYDTPVPEPPEAELAQLARDVHTLGTSLQETEARRMRLIGEVAHEMRTPLTVIDGYVEGFIDGVIPTSPQELSRLSQETRRLRASPRSLPNRPAPRRDVSMSTRWATSPAPSPEQRSGCGHKRRTPASPSPSAGMLCPSGTIRSGSARS